MLDTIQNLGEFGIVSDAYAGELPKNAWSDGSNVRFTSGYAQRIGGYLPIFTAPSVIPYALFSYSSSTTSYFIHAGIARVFSDDGTTRTDLTPASPYTGNVDDRWTGGSFNGLMILNNGVDQPQYWNGNTATDFANITGWNAAWRCGFMRPFKNYLVAGDVTKTGTRYSSLVKWSSLADPGALPASWDETNPAVEAGEVPLADSPDALIDAMPLGDQLILYKERSMYAMQPSGDQYIFRITRLPWDVGMIARGCGAVTPKGHVVLTASDVVIHNGSQPQSILTDANGDDRMRRWLFDRIDQTNWRRCYLIANNNTSEVWICFPETGQNACTKALLWNWLTNTFGVATLSNTTCAAQGVTQGGSQTWNGDTMTWDSDVTPWGQSSFGNTQTTLVMGTTAPLLIGMEKSNDFAGAPFDSSITRKHACIDGDPSRYKLLKGIRPRFDAPPGTIINIQVAGSPSPDVEPTFSAPTPFVVGSSFKADVLASGRFHSVQFSSSGSQPWRLKSYDVEFEGQGAF